VYFDHDNNSFAEQSGWVGKDDGLLVFDKNNNGKIDDGSELFGNFVICACCGGKTTLLLMGVVAAIYFIRIAVGGIKRSKFQ
jgi:hypothetical protein